MKESNRCERCGALLSQGGALDGQCPCCLMELGLANDAPSLQHGAQVGVYQIEEVLGEGGMGVVYLARDNRLNRLVAIKFLSGDFADLAARRRFQREAQTASSLNHPHILTVHDVGEHEGRQYLVTEYIDGGTLKEWARPEKSKERRTSRQMVELLTGIADALATAHAAGILHRDVKPGNILISSKGYAKLADFGLASPVRGAALAGAAGDATLTEGHPAGAILGTLSYMSPEQASGQPLDARSDIFSFGVVLYELLSGRRPFSGETGIQVLERVIHQPAEPLSLEVPQDLRNIVEKALEKDADDRYQSMRELVIDLKRAQRPRPTVGGVADEIARWGASWGRKGRRVLPMLLPVAGMVALVVGLSLWLRSRSPAPSPLAGHMDMLQPVRFQIPLTVTPASLSVPAVSPDGHYVAFTAAGPDGVYKVWLRPLGSLDAQPLSGAEISSGTTPVFWSPDSRSIAFDAAGKLKRIDISGGLARTLCDVPTTVVGGSWNRDGTILFGNIGSGLMRVQETGGVATPVTALDPSRQETYHVFPSFLPDGRHFLYLRVSRSAPEKTGVYLGSLDSKPEEQDRKQLLAASYGAVYAPGADGGHVLFLREGKLIAQPFDTQRLELTGSPVVIAERISSFADVGFFSASASGVLVYRTAQDFQLTWFDRKGNAAGRVLEPGLYGSLALSPDGTRAAVAQVSSTLAVNIDLWLVDLSRNSRTRFTSDGYSSDPVWSPDGNRIIFSSIASSAGGWLDLYSKPVSGVANQEAVLKSSQFKVPTSWSRDGKSVLYTVSYQKSKDDLWVLPMEGDRKPVLLAGTEANEGWGHFSPDGHWIAYTNDESGRNEVYIRPFPNPGDKVLVSRGGGGTPRWRGDGKELFYVASDGSLMALELTTSPMLDAGEPKMLFMLPRNAGAWDVSRDGDRFLFAVPVLSSAQESLTVVLNWTSGLPK